MYKLLENPYINNCVQKLFEIGQGKLFEFIEKYIKGNLHGRILDVGCGTGRYSHLFNRDCIGLDINYRYLNINKKNDIEFICADAVDMPFKNDCLDSIFSIGFFHHISPVNTEKIFKEFIRIGKHNVNILMIDPFYPVKRHNILSWLLVKIDRGRFIRHKKEFLKELEKYFSIIREDTIEYSYLYNLNTFLLEIK